MTKGSETITRIRGTGEANRHGEKTGQRDRQSVQECVVWPRTSVETEVVIDGYNVYAPPTPVAIDIQASDRVECRGEEWDIEGTPGDYRNKHGKRKGILLTLKKVGT